MPSYATIADMRARFDEQELIELTDDERTGVLNDVRLTRALVQADNIIDAYVAAFYKRADATLPVPPLLTDLACDIAHYRSFRRDSATESSAERHKAALKTLQDIARGIVKLDQGDEAAQIPARDGMVLVEASPKRFGRDAMAGF